MLLESTTWRVAEVFFREPTREHYLKEISRRLGIAHTAVKRALDALLERKIIACREERRASRVFPMYRAAREENEFKRNKLLYNLDTLHKLSAHLMERLTPDCIILFGSYARAEDVEESDVDLYLQCREERPDLARFEATLGRRIELHFHERFTDLPPEMRYSIMNGVVLAGWLSSGFTATRTKRRPSRSLPKQASNGSGRATG